MDELWDETETATFLKKPPGTLRQWRYQKVGPKPLKVGQAVRYRRSDVLAWIEAGGNVTPEPASPRRRAS